MIARLTCLVLLFSCVSVFPLFAAANDGKVVNGSNFEGAIFTPSMLQGDGGGISLMGQTVTWTPPVSLIVRAEKALPAAIANVARSPRHSRANWPVFYTRKNATNLNLSKEPPDLIMNQSSDSDFVPNIAPILAKYKRQYVGLEVNGQKVLLLSFIYDPNHSLFPGWKEHWIEVLDGGDNFWRVIYNPKTGRFSDWDCNGSA